MFNPLDKILKASHKSLDDLNDDELKYYQYQQSLLESSPPTITQQVENLEELIYNLTMELVETRTSDQKDTYLKARIKNAITIKDSLTVSEKTKKRLEKQAERAK